MKIFVSTAIWGRDYLRTFVDVSLASQLAPGNLPRATRRHAFTYHILTTKDGARWLERQPTLRALRRHAEVRIESIEALGFDAGAVPTGPEGAKYRFLSILQNVAIERALDHDALVFNYADFVWCDGALSHAIERLENSVDAVLSFCLPVDQAQGLRRLAPFRKPDAHGAPVLALPAREGAGLAIECLHREAKLRHWDEPPFTVTPTYLLWRVPSAGLLVRAYHQTILVLRVHADDPEYRRGIVSGNLDSHFTAMLAKRGNSVHAADSDECLVFSLYDTIVDSSIGGASRTDWTGYDRAASLRECLRGVIGLEQRKFAAVALRVRASDADPAIWADVEARSRAVLAKFEAETPFDPWEFERLHTEGATLAEAAAQWRAAALAARRGAARFIPSAVRGVFLAHARISYARTMTALAGPLASAIKAVIGPARARAVRLSVMNILFPAASDAPALPDRAPTDEEALEWLAAGRVAALLAWMDRYAVGFDIAPGVRLPSRAASCIAVATIVERQLPDFADMERLGRVLLGAEAALRELVALAPDWPQAPIALAKNLWFQGRFDEALAMFDREGTSRAALAERAGWRLDDRVYLPDNCVEVIGLMGHIDAFVKMRVLTGDPRRQMLIAREDRVVNPAFLAYWRDFVEIDLRPIGAKGASPYELSLTANWNWTLPDDKGEIVQVHRAMARIQRRWAAEGRAPLLRLSDAHRALLDRARERWGMRPDHWYVCLHVRSPGFYKERGGTAQAFRNTPIEDYYPAMAMVVESGGWVVRMGDPGMPPLDPARLGPAAARVIDYAHSADRDPALDVALCAECRLFVSSPSGLHTVAHAFGRPACYVNYPIYAGFPWHPGEIFAPKLYHSKHFGRAMTIEEVLSGTLTCADHQFLLDVAGVTLEDNPPEVIERTVREALFPEACADLAAPRALAVRAAFDDANRRHARDISGRLSLGFAGAYADALLPAAAVGSGAP
jgi:putative glycosyltransferase (TIGR04372 family)